jgi:hypothetical protein
VFLGARLGVLINKRTYRTALPEFTEIVQQVDDRFCTPGPTCPHASYPRINTTADDRAASPQHEHELSTQPIPRSPATHHVYASRHVSSTVVRG